MTQSTAVALLPCPRCGRKTDSLKRFDLADWFVFLLVFWWMRKSTHTACPQCIRKAVVVRSLRNLVPANVGNIILIPINLAVIIATFTKGHNKQVIQTVENERGEDASKAGRTSDAIAHHAAALAVGETGRQDEEARAHLGLADAYSASGDAARARKHYERADVVLTGLGLSSHPTAQRARARLAALSRSS